jgi:hypothetical protein
LNKKANVEDDYYYKACAYALTENKSEAVKLLGQAISKDIACKYRARSDEDLKNLKMESGIPETGE